MGGDDFLQREDGVDDRSQDLAGDTVEDPVDGDLATFGVDELAVFVAGFFAATAGLPAPAGAPQVRRFQRQQLEVALPWACATLWLPLQ